VKATVEHHGRAQTAAHEEKAEVRNPARRAVVQLGEGGEVDVVLDSNRDAELLLELRAQVDVFEPRKVGRRDPAVAWRDDRRDPYHRAGDQLWGEPARLQQRSDDAAEGPDPLVRRAGDRHVLPCSQVAGQVTDRDAEEARSEIDAEHERGLGVRLVIDGAVVRPVGVVRGLAHEAVVEERL